MESQIISQEIKKKIKHHSKWCFICGRKVDLRNKNSYQINENLKVCNNSEYHYICGSECKHKFRIRLGLEQEDEDGEDFSIARSRGVFQKGIDD